MKTLLCIAKALADESRLRVLRALDGRELCVCQITELLGVSMPTVSRHLSILQGAGLVDSRKRGRWVYYRLPDAPSPEVACSLAWLKSMFRDHAATDAEDDVRSLNAILCCSTEDLCRRQREN